MSIRKTIKWILLIVLAFGMVGGGYGYWMWSNANALLLERIRGALAEAAPEWRIEVENARFDWHRRVHLYNVTLKSPDGRSEIVRIREAVLIVDRDKLADEVVDVQRIRILDPTLNLVRDSAGVWNWQKLPPWKPGKDRDPLPEIVVENATANVRLEQADGRPPADLLLKQAEVKLVPSERRAFLVQCATTIRDAGRLNLTGQWWIDRKTWSVDGRMQDMDASGELLGLAVGVSPELRQNVARLEQALRELTPADERPITPVDADALPNLGASATVDLDFHFENTAAHGEPQFEVHATFRNGRLENPALPFPLNDLEGKVHWTNDRIEINEVGARNGPTGIVAAASVRRVGGRTPARVALRITDLPLDERLRKRLPPDVREDYDTIHPRGRIDVSGTLSYDGERKWTPSGFTLVTRNCSFSHSDFPYRFTGVNGAIAQQPDGETLKIEVAGFAGRQPATFSGTVKSPGPTAATRFDLYVKDFALDESFLLACKPSLQKSLRSLGVAGRADVHFRSQQKEGVDRTPTIVINADLNDCVIDYDHFPYRLSRLTGNVAFDSRTDRWTFSDLKAFNGETRLAGSAVLGEERGLSYLDLKVEGTAAVFDNALYRALPERLQKLWDELSPQGRFDLGVQLNWKEGGDVVVSIPHCRLQNGAMHVKSFPYKFEKVAAKFAYAANHLRIISFTAMHDDTQLRAAGFADIDDNGDWRLRLVEFYADDLVPNRRFRQALGGKLQKVVDELDPQGLVSISGMLEFAGTKRDEDPVTAAWDVKLVLAGNSLNAGVKLTNIHGTVAAVGTWDGVKVDMKSRKGNRFDLESATVHGYQFTKISGPFRLYDDQLAVGSEEIFKPQTRSAGRDRSPPKRKIDPKSRITATAVGGTFTLDAIARIGKQDEYRLLITMNKGRLERFAKRYLNGARDLRGVMYGWIELGGRGTGAKDVAGRGKLLISPAAIYELPVLAQTFKVLNFSPPGKTAFTFAYTDFDVADREFRFNRIDLVGDAISLRGQGTARFDGKLALDFYSMLTRNRMPVAILKDLVSTATAGWVGVKVRGTVDRPVAQIQAVPQVEDALKNFLHEFGTIPQGGVPFFPQSAAQSTNPPRQPTGRQPTGRQPRRNMPAPARPTRFRLPFRIPGLP